jgi:hypothetical protein
MKANNEFCDERQWCICARKAREARLEGNAYVGAGTIFLSKKLHIGILGDKMSTKGFKFMT